MKPTERLHRARPLCCAANHMSRKPTLRRDLGSRSSGDSPNSSRRQAQSLMCHVGEFSGWQVHRDLASMLELSCGLLPKLTSLSSYPAREGPHELAGLASSLANNLHTARGDLHGNIPQVNVDTICLAIGRSTKNIWRDLTFTSRCGIEGAAILRSPDFKSRVYGLFKKSKVSPGKSSR